MDIRDYKQVIKWAGDLDQVFSIKDLQVIKGSASDSSIYRMVSQLVKAQELIKVKRGIYATKSATLAAISSRIYPKSYISIGAVLADQLVIGSIPAKRIQAVKIGMPRQFRCSLGSIEYLSISPKFYFGFQRKNGQLWACPEKALIDACYFVYRGKKQSFNLSQDVNSERLNREIIFEYLKVYDPRFVTFFHKHISL